MRLISKGDKGDTVITKEEHVELTGKLIVCKKGNTVTLLTYQSICGHASKISINLWPYLSLRYQLISGHTSNMSINTWHTSINQYVAYF